MLAALYQRYNIDFEKRRIFWKENLENRLNWPNVQFLKEISSKMGQKFKNMYLASKYAYIMRNKIRVVQLGIF